MGILESILTILGQITAFAQLLQVVLDLLSAIGLLPAA